jgi:galactokinase
MKTKLVHEFRDRFKKEPDHIFFCPGRVNLIGEHIDYNGGKVMPCAVSLGTWLAVSKNTDKKLRFRCLNFPETAELQLQESYSKTGGQWFNYPLGVINELLQNNYSVSGLDMLFYGNLPIGAGLSSSASIEVLTTYALSELFILDLSKKEIAVMSKKVENEFIGVNCGIMDQFAVTFGKKDNAVLLDCDTLEYEYLPLHLGEYVLAIINTNKPRKLVESKYNERFTECGSALKALKAKLPVNNLCEVSFHDFSAYRHLINNPVLEKRVLHVISEYERVEEAVVALNAGEIKTFGKLMFDSHVSLKDFYEVSGKELDTIVEFCKHYNSCIGARMTGAGFGGCAIALVKKSEFEDFSEKISVYYQKHIGFKPGVFSSEVGEGVREIN